MAMNKSKNKGIYQINIANERKQMMKSILDKLWNGPYKVNNKLDSHWYVRLSEVSKAIEEYETTNTR